MTEFWTRLGADERLYAKYKAMDVAALNTEQRQAHKNAMRNFVPEEKIAEGLRIYRAFWDTTMLDGAEPMPGARELLEQLHTRGVSCGVFTNKHGPSARAVCAHLGLTPFLDLILGATDTDWLKPQPAFAAHALAALKANASTTCLVGDSPWDVQAAHAAGFPCFAVTTGTHTADELRAAGADAVYNSLLALAAGEFSLNATRV